MWILLHLVVKRGSSVWFEFVFALVFRVGLLCGRGTIWDLQETREVKSSRSCSVLEIFKFWGIVVWWCQPWWNIFWISHFMATLEVWWDGCTAASSRNVGFFTNCFFFLHNCSLLKLQPGTCFASALWDNLQFVKGQWPRPRWSLWALISAYKNPFLSTNHASPPTKTHPGP